MKTISKLNVCALLIVVLMLLMVAPLFNWRVFKFNEKGRKAITCGRMCAFMNAMTLYKEDFGMFPGVWRKEAFQRLSTVEYNDRGEKLHDIYIKPDLPEKTCFGVYRCSVPVDEKTGEYLDAWGNPFKLRVFADGHFEIRSDGPNRMDDSGRKDDIVLVSHALSK